MNATSNHPEFSPLTPAEIVAARAEYVCDSGDWDGEDCTVHRCALKYGRCPVGERAADDSDARASGAGHEATGREP